MTDCSEGVMREGGKEGRKEGIMRSMLLLYICRFATLYLTRLLTPLVALFALRSLLYEQHSSWYSWAIGACTGCVYSFGFVLMCPQLYINHQLKSVSHLPWKVNHIMSS